MAPKKPSKGVNQEAAKAIRPVRKSPPSTGVNQSARGATTSRGVNQAAAKSIPRAAKAKPAPVAPPAPRSSGRAATSPPPASSARSVSTAPAGVAPAAPTASNADIETTARNLYGHMAWALDEPELGKVLRQAAAEGWDPARLKGAVFATNWFKTHGTHKVATAIKEQADAYLVPMDDQSRRNWAMKVITGEVQPTEMNQYLKEQSKSMFPHLAGAIDRGVTVKDYASPYRAIAAQTLELPPEQINLNEPRWRRALDGQVNPQTNERAPMSLADWEKTLKTSSEYGYDFTKGARAEAAAFAAKLQETFGAR